MGTLADAASSDLQNVRRTDIVYDGRRNPVRETVSANGAVYAVTDKSWDLAGRNYPNTGQSSSQVNRRDWARLRRDYWAREKDNGRFDD